jgi:hypothetical protein
MDHFFFCFDVLRGILVQKRITNFVPKDGWMYGRMGEAEMGKGRARLSVKGRRLNSDLIYY